MNERRQRLLCRIGGIGSIGYSILSLYLVIAITYDSFIPTLDPHFWASFYIALMAFLLALSIWGIYYGVNIIHKPMDRANMPLFSIALTSIFIPALALWLILTFSLFLGVRV